jgi:ribonuclease Z
MHLYGRQKTLVLVGPPGLREILTLQLRYSETQLRYEVDFREWEPEKIQTVVDHEKFFIETIPLDHRVPCSGYLIKEKPKKRRLIRENLDRKLTPAQVNELKEGRDLLDEKGELIYENKLVTRDPVPSFAYAYCSDTRYKEDIVTQIKGVDLLYHEATFMKEMTERAHNTYHTTTEEAALIAQKASVGKLLIGHFSTRYKELEPVIEETQGIFVNSELALEGKSFIIN